MKNKNIFFIPQLSLSLLTGGSLSVLILFNLPLFYEQDRYGLIKVFLVTFLTFSLMIYLSRKLLSIPLKYLEEKNVNVVLLLAILSLFLGSVFYFTSTYYWSTPNFHSVEVCYQSDDPSGILRLYKVSDVENGRIYSAGFFDFEDHPISISANACITGGIRTVQKWRGVIVEFEEKTGDDSIKVIIDRQVTKKSLANDDGVEGIATIEVPASSYKGSTIYPNIFSSIFLISVKWASLMLSSVYLAMIIFALSDMVIFPEEKRSDLSKIALGFVLVYFVLFGFFMVNHAGQPDQRMHEYFSSRYTETWGIPKDDPQSPYFTTDNEYLYYWINGAVAKIYHLLTPVALIKDRFVWRLLSVLMSAGTLYYVYKITYSVTGNKMGGVLASFFLANTLMFVFVSGGVSYDNLMTLSSTAAVYHLVRLVKRDDYVKNTALLGIWLSLGSLAKNQVALLAFILFGVWLFVSFYYRKEIKFQFTRLNVIFIIMFVLAFGLFLEFYGGNLSKYHKPIPSCRQVKSPEVCTNFDYRAAQRQKVDYSELWADRNKIIGPIEYASNYWFYAMVNGIWGIVSHKTYVPRLLTSLHECLIVWSTLCFARYWKRSDSVSVALLATLMSYGGCVFLMNYNSELHYNFRHYAVQGRYLFPVLGVFLALMTNTFLNIRPLFLKRLTLSLAVILYFSGGLGTFMFRYSDVFIGWRIFYNFL